ncbi:hypothetical protein [Cellulomonas triticagri]|uniref:Uncharacterized protein n=1 Tax=Cellulomonas triticagri TaxID=2483352 RepID=A0A3M2JJZ8_9CELL|nr:hypothetical protein [Cellulomonas triticagri]RMI13444.1 hypothetical protein EBM89_04295 [Cellulomonas triticagri]
MEKVPVTTTQDRHVPDPTRDGESTDEFFARLVAEGRLIPARLPLSAVRLPDHPRRSHEEIDRILIELGYDVAH